MQREGEWVDVEEGGRESGCGGGWEGEWVRRRVGGGVGGWGPPPKGRRQSLNIVP